MKPAVWEVRLNRTSWIDRAVSLSRHLAILSLAACMHLSPMPPREGRATGVAPDPADWDYFRATPLMVPVEGVTPEKVKDSFHGERSGGRVHYAIDIMAPKGTPVLAATRGKVTRLKSNELGGITLYENDVQGRFTYYYAHLDRYAPGVKEGMDVEQGDLLGYVGNTGDAATTASHLHFQALRIERTRRDWWNGEPVDVRLFLVLEGRKRE